MSEPTETPSTPAPIENSVIPASVAGLTITEPTPENAMPAPLSPEQAMAMDARKEAHGLLYDLESAIFNPIHRLEDAAKAELSRLVAAIRSRI